MEASWLGTDNIPGFGDCRVGHRKFISLGYTHIFAPSLTGEVRVGGNRVNLEFLAQSALKGLTATSFGINSSSVNFPDLRISGGPTFGGLSGNPQGRTDTTFQNTYALSWF